MCKRQQAIWDALCAWKDTNEGSGATSCSPEFAARAVLMGCLARMLEEEDGRNKMARFLTDIGDHIMTLLDLVVCDEDQLLVNGQRYNLN